MAKAISILQLFDKRLTEYILLFLKPYFIPPNPPYFTAHLPQYTKAVFYLVVVLIPLSILKLFFIGKRKLTWLLILIVGVIGLTTAGIFCGFFQLLFI